MLGGLAILSKYNAVFVFVGVLAYVLTVPSARRFLATPGPWLAAFDCDRPEFKRVLFVAHREEILAQARHTFRRIRPAAVLGHYTGVQKDERADVLPAGKRNR